MFCDRTNLTAPVDMCAAGFYCTEGVDTATPTDDLHTGQGDVCPIGHYCPEGTVNPIGCAAGTYQVSYVIHVFIISFL